VSQVTQLSGNLQKTNSGMSQQRQYVRVLGCDCIGRQGLERAEVTAAAREDVKGDVTRAGDEVRGLARSRGQRGEGGGRKSPNVGAARRRHACSPFGRYS